MGDDRRSRWGRRLDMAGDLATGLVEAGDAADGCIGCAHGLHCLPLLLIGTGVPILLFWMR